MFNYSDIPPHVYAEERAKSYAEAYAEKVRVGSLIRAVKNCSNDSIDAVLSAAKYEDFKNKELREVVNSSEEKVTCYEYHKAERDKEYKRLQEERVKYKEENEKLMLKTFSDGVRAAAADMSMRSIFFERDDGRIEQAEVTTTITKK